jgi:CHAT domain-containing protein/lipopolysaccharide biosynthesis regulator YciM
MVPTGGHIDKKDKMISKSFAGVTSGIGMILLVVLTVIPVSMMAQQKPDTLEAFRALQKGDELHQKALYDSSNTYYQRAALIYGNSGTVNRRIDALYKLSQNKISQGETKEAARILNSALELYQKEKLNDTEFEIKVRKQKGLIAELNADYESALRWYREGLELANASEGYIPLKIRLFAGIGDVYDYQGKYDEAIQEFAKAEELYHKHGISDKQLLSRIYNSYGVAHQHDGNPDQSLKYYEQSLEIDRNRLPKHHPDLAKRYNNIAIVYYFQSDYRRALDYLENALQILEEFHGKYHWLVGRAYNNVGSVYSDIGQFEKAITYLQTAQEIRKKVLGETHPDVAVGYQNMGAIYYDMEKYNQAISYYKRAEDLFLENFPEGNPGLSNVYFNLGEAYAKKENYKEALDYYFRDLENNKKILDADHPYIGETYSRIGETYTLLENYPMALQYYEQALSIFVTDFSEENTLRNLSLDRVISPAELLKTLQFKADALSKFYERDGDQQLLERSLQTYLQTSPLIDELQQSYYREDSKFLLREQMSDFYKKGFKTAYTLLKKTENPDYKEYAFYFAEKSKNQILLGQLQEINAQKFANIPDSLIVRENTLKTHLSDLQQQLSAIGSSPQQSDSLKRAALQDSLFHGRRKLSDFINNLEQSYPRYYELKYRQLVTPTSEVQESLSSGQTLIRYFFGQDSLFAFVISKKRFDIRELASDSLIRQDIAQYQKLISGDSSPQKFSEISYLLYNQLFEPVSDLIVGKELVIIPDGVLHYVPFESLVNQRSDNDRFRNLSFLVNSYTISYAPTATNLTMRQSRPGNNQKQFVGFAPVFSDITESKRRSLYPDFERPLSALLQSKKEVSELQSLFNNDNGFFSFLTPEKNQADIFSEDRATESAFKNLPLRNYRYIHLATHAYVSVENPARSGILFSIAENDGEDGTLYASEIYNLRLDAHRVTLSACKTGVGAMAKGEGIMSLSRAFQYAGAQNLLVSLWNVDDRSTAELMISFYRLNQTEESIPEALRKAKLKMMTDSQFTHPKYWAPFVFIRN